LIDRLMAELNSVQCPGNWLVIRRCTEYDSASPKSEVTRVRDFMRFQRAKHTT